MYRQTNTTHFAFFLSLFPMSTVRSITDVVPEVPLFIDVGQEDQKTKLYRMPWLFGEGPGLYSTRRIEEGEEIGSWDGAAVCATESEFRARMFPLRHAEEKSEFAIRVVGERRVHGVVHEALYSYIPKQRRFDSRFPGFYFRYRNDIAYMRNSVHCMEEPNVRMVIDHRSMRIRFVATRTISAETVVLPGNQVGHIPEELVCDYGHRYTEFPAVYLQWRAYR
jgi:hypothetical protein